jgi:photosystem II stability/assembly factor-like uncharacterized protein
MGTFSKPVWTEQGPGPLALPMAGYSEAAGAIQAVAPDPVDPDRVFVATVGSGIWLSTDAVSAVQPTWTPLTDQQPSLSMSAIAFSPLDPNRNTLFAGCGATSHSDPLVGANSGPLLGLLMTTDGGGTWTEIARSTFQRVTITRILPTEQITQLGQVILVATWGAGLLRSADGGQSWIKVVGLGDDHVADVVADPLDPQRVYAATWSGVFRSDDGGDQNWTDIGAGLGKLPPYPIIKFSFSKVTDLSGSRRLYAVVGKWNSGSGLFFTTDAGASWTNLGLPPDTSLPAPPMAASPLYPETVFCISDNGGHWLVTGGAGTAPAQWTQIDLAGANGTAPHIDGRDCAFSADPNVMFETDDGGIYRLVNPHGMLDAPARVWQPAVGNLRIAEFHAIAYDSANHVLFGATQDNSVPQQTAPDAIAWGINERPARDGFEVGVDNAAQGGSVHYSSQQYLFEARRRTYASPTQVTLDVAIPFIINGTGGLKYNDVEGALTPDIKDDLGTVRWNQSWVVNAVAGNRILLGTDYLYESFDRGDTFDSLGGLTKNKNGEWIPDNRLGSVSAYAYGHLTNPDVIWVGAGGKLLLRSGGQGLPAVVAAYPGSTPAGIALGSDWRWAYVLDDQGRVFRTLDAGTNFQELTGNLPTLTGDVRTIEAFTAHGEVIFVAGYGGVFACKNPRTGKFAFWQKHGNNFPNAVVTGLHYSAADDVLIAGTLGRGAFSLKKVTDTVTGGPRLTILPSTQSSCLGGWLADSTGVFSAYITDAADLTPPLTFEWAEHGAASTSQVLPSQLVVKMPPAGQEVDVMLTVTDATGFKLFAAVSDTTVTSQVLQLRDKLCELIKKIKMTAIFNWPIDPLGPPIQPGDGPLTREVYSAAEVVVRELGSVLVHLSREDGREVAHAARAFAVEPQAEAWKRAYPSAEDGKYIIPLRAETRAGAAKTRSE